MSSHIPSSAGTFSVRREKLSIRGRTVRTCTLVFTTHDGYVGESRPKSGRFNHREAYEAAVAKRALATYTAQQAEMTRLPKPFERCSKPAPAVQMLNAINDSLLFSEVERRGYEVALAS